MKLPQFRLRTLFLLTTLVGVIACIGTIVMPILSWIRHRHEFLGADDVFKDFEQPHEYVIRYDDPNHPFPWKLRFFGETLVTKLSVPPQKVDRAKELFPEAHVINRDTRK